MTTTITNARPPASGRTGFAIVPLARRTPVNRNEALRAVREARRRLQGRQERFAHLKRMYD